MPARSVTSAGDAPRPRKDAVRNRALLLRTADQLIAERGLDITFHELAAAAQLGVGTVYRHFTSRDELLGALIEDRFGAARAILEGAEQITDPVHALREAILRICELQQADRGTMQAMLSSSGRLRSLAREQVMPATHRIVARAQASGRLRPDFTATDWPMIFTLSGSLHQDVRPSLWRRYVEALLDGFMLHDADRSGPATPAPTEPESEHIAGI